MRKWRANEITGVDFADVSRFLAKRIVLPDGCWQWTAYRNKAGYGVFGLKGKVPLAHRFAYIVFRGPIDPSMQLDHLCRNPGCCNPNHLEIVTNLENSKRGRTGLAMKNKTVCKNGHPFSKENTTVRQDGARSCRVCHHESYKRRRARLLNDPSDKQQHPRDKTKCLNGHEFDQENTYIRRNGSRVCRLCVRKRRLEWLNKQ